jgi:predicted acyltransferase
MPVVAASRIASLDQFRGYTVFGMLLVNFVGGWDSSPRLLRHTHDYCGYADTIMPQFLFAAGFAMQLSLGRRIAAGESVPWRRVIRRIIGLALVAVVWYSVTGWGSIRERWQSGSIAELLLFLTKRQWMQTLLHIAITSLWILPVIGRPLRWRVLLAVVSAAIHTVLSWWFNFEWVNAQPVGIDGGPLGFLTWSLPALAGTGACDFVRSNSTAASRRAGIPLIVRGAVMMLAAWSVSNLSTLYDVPADRRVMTQNQKLAPDPVVPVAAHVAAWDCSLIEPPFVPPPSSADRQWNYWMMSQRCGTWTYTLFAAGFSLLVFAIFHWLCDGNGWRLGMFRTFGTNALAAYILHDIAGWIVGPWLPESAPLTHVTLGFVPFLALVYAACRLLEWRGWLIRM